MTTAALGAVLSQKIVTQSGITVNIPAGWEQIPHDVLTSQFLEMATENPQLGTQTYEAGFQAPSEQWFTYPYLLVQVQRKGRIPDAALKEMPELDSMMKSKMKETAAMVSTIAEAAMEQTIYDSEQRILWTSARMNYAGVGNIRMLAGGHLSEQGLVFVYAYSSDKDFPQYESTFHDIISNIEVPVGMRYVPRVTDNMTFIHTINWSNVASKGVTGAIVGGIVALMFGVSRRKKKKFQQDTGV